jgi:hypothetical protein
MEWHPESRSEKHRHVRTPIMSLVYTIIRYIQPYSTIILCVYIYTHITIYILYILLYICIYISVYW